MISDALQFWNSISGKIKQAIKSETQNTFRCERYEVTTAPNGTKIGVTLPFGTNEIFLPYSKEVEEATVGDPVLVVWWGSMSNAKVYYFANGYDGANGKAVVKATISFPSTWTDSTYGYFTATPTVTGYTVTANSKIDLEPSAAGILNLQYSGTTAMFVENNNGVLTAYAVNNAPGSAMTMQCTITEVGT